MAVFSILPSTSGGSGRAGKKRSQLIKLNCQQSAQEFIVAAVFIPAHAFCAFRKDGTRTALPERIFTTAGRDQGCTGILQFGNRTALFPQIPVGATGIQRIKHFIPGFIVEILNERTALVVDNDQSPCRAVAS